MLAVIKTGAKQYVIKKGDILTTEKLQGDVNDSVKFDEVLLISNEGDLTLGTPCVKGAVVEAKILEHPRAKKVWGIKHKAKKRYKKKFGHKQELTKIEITEISKK